MKPTNSPKISTYTFGYLFVRFSKLIALLAVICTGLTSAYLLVDYNLKTQGLTYRKTQALELHCKQLSEEFEFAKKEVARLSPTQDISIPSFTTGASSSGEFEELSAQLKTAQKKEAELKNRLTAKFRENIENLRNKIKATIESVERARLESNKTTQTKQSEPGDKEEPQTSSPPTSSGQRNVFDNIQNDRIERIHAMLNQGVDALEELNKSVEKEENQRIIKDAKLALQSLDSWIPDKTAKPSTPMKRSTPSPSPEPNAQRDPLKTAIENYEGLGILVRGIEGEIQRDWKLNSILIETTTFAETESVKCRNAETTIKVARLSYLGKTGIVVAAGLAAAFLILVFADLLQSFFDTASNSGAIRGILENKND